MNFEDTLEVLNATEGGYDEDFNPVPPTEEWVAFPSCFISFNSSAQKVRLNDGTEYVYSYYVIVPVNKKCYPVIPKEGDRVRIRKKDGTINAEMEVKGFVTFKRRYLKIWL